MSAYNAERHVAEAVDSVLAQTFPDFEFLIFDDASTDRTREVLRGYSDPRIRLVENEVNVGLTRNLERGMHVADSEFVARMDADDVCMPQRLAKQVAYLGLHPETAVLGSAVTFFGEGREPFVCYQPLAHDEIKCALLYGFTMLHPSVMMRKAEFDRHGLSYDPAFQVSQDHDLWVRAIRKLQFENLPDSLLQLRVHSGKIGASHSGLQRQLSDVVRRRQLEELGLTVTATELRVFGEHDIIDSTWTTAECRCFEDLLLRIFQANASASIFHQATLIKMGSARFRGACRQLLISGNRAGGYYWRSRIRPLDTPTIRELAGLIYRSGQCITARRACQK